MCARWQWRTGWARARGRIRRAGRRLALPRASALQGHVDTFGRGHRRGARRGGGRLQRLHHQGVHHLLRAPAVRAPPARARHSERDHVGPGAPSFRRGRRAHRHTRRDPHARGRAGRSGGRALAVLVVPGPRARRDTLGTQATVGDLDAPDIRRFFAHHYRPGNMVVSVAGDCTHEGVAADLERRFAGQPGGTAPVRTAPGPEAERLHVVRRPTEQAHVVYGVRSVSRFDERRFALAVLNHVLGGGLSSRLFQKVRERTRSGVLGLVRARHLPRCWFAGRRRRHRSGQRGRGAAYRHRRARAAGRARDHRPRARRGQGNLRAEMLLSGEDSGARMGRHRARPCSCTAKCRRSTRCWPALRRSIAHEVLARAQELVGRPARSVPSAPSTSTPSPTTLRHWPAIRVQHHAQGRCGRGRRPDGPRGLPRRRGRPGPRARRRGGPGS